MEKELIELYEKCKQDRKAFVMLKETAVRAHNFELAANLREEEMKLWPDTDEVKAEKDRAAKLVTAFAMIHVNCQEPLAWQVAEVNKLVGEVGGQFTVDDATRIIFRSQEIFGK